MRFRFKFAILGYVHAILRHQNSAFLRREKRRFFGGASCHQVVAMLSMFPEVEVITRDRSGLYADGGRQGAPSAVRITDRYHLVSNLGEAMERDVQQLQIDARRQLTQTVAGRPREAKKLTLIEARRQRCRQARYERYLAVVELHRQGHTQLAIAERIGIGPETIARWWHAPEFPERRIRSDRRPDRALIVQEQERGRASVRNFQRIAREAGRSRAAGPGPSAWSHSAVACAKPNHLRPALAPSAGSFAPT
jgi:hypothetical protein